MKILQKVRNVRALQIEVARDQENIFHFELCVNKE